MLKAYSQAVGDASLPIPTKDILWGSMPYVLVMFLAIILLCVFPNIATRLPNQMPGTVR
ncbi:hypothetical protein [Sinorhizobium meliloti]|uniref:hypothetical protein n=1 Tax=Rhizobium meliloti TaxID=382 RepID=UPI001297F892|nr:hypothetical protein [Sinorhizobium meliloti]MQX57226.1 hypothetical protein [Sinorhizobium meliloti]